MLHFVIDVYAQAVFVGSYNQYQYQYNIDNLCIISDMWARGGYKVEIHILTNPIRDLYCPDCGVIH